MEWLLAGNKLQKCRIQFLPEISKAGKILLLGEGHGRFLSELLRANPSAQVTCVDSSANMLAVTGETLRRRGVDVAALVRARLIHTNVLECDLPPGPYDAVVTQFFLDCFTPNQQKELIAKIARQIVPGGTWLLADFRQPEQGLQRLRAALILKLMYLFFRVVTGLPARNLTEPDSYLKQNGFTLMDRRLSEWGLLHTDLWRKTRL